MLAVSDQSDYEDFEWLLMADEKFHFWNQANKALTWADFALFAAKMETKNFKRHFLQFHFRDLNKASVRTIQAFDLKFSTLFL